MQRLRLPQPAYDSFRLPGGHAGAPQRMIRAALLVLLLAGCAPDLSALANDKNSDCATVTTLWGTVHFERNWGCSAAKPAP